MGRLQCHDACSVALMIIFLSVHGSFYTSAAQEPGGGEAPVPQIELGEEYSEFAQGPTRRHTSGAQEEDSSVFRAVVFYLPNRVLDLIDIFRVDVGVGPAVGAVVRVTKYGQVGFRSVAPASVRVGLQGRRSPVFVEHSSEFGVGPLYVESHDRTVTPVEVGAGADLLLVGAYAGVSLDEAFDFLAGLLTFDPKGDDIE